MITFGRIDLAHPPGVAVTSCTYLDLGVEEPELEFLQIGGGCGGHGLNLNQRRGNSNGVIKKGMNRI
jgi:hypothetical protein